MSTPLRKTASNRPAPRLKFGDYVRAARRELNMSQGAFANLIEINRQTLAAWETGRNTPDELPEVATLLQERTGFSRAFFLGWGDVPTPGPAAGVRIGWKNSVTRLRTPVSVVELGYAAA